MEHLDSWFNYNVKNYLSAKEFVTDNFLRLKKLVPDITLDDYSIFDMLVSYYSRFPDEKNKFSVTSVGRPSQLAVPRLYNIGGTIKYR